MHSSDRLGHLGDKEEVSSLMVQPKLKVDSQGTGHVSTRHQPCQSGDRLCLARSEHRQQWIQGPAIVGT